MNTQIVKQRLHRSWRPLLGVLILATILYWVTNSVLFSTVIVGGALIGLAAALAGDLRGAHPPTERTAGKRLSPRTFLLHDWLVVRFAALVGVGALIFVGAWMAGYFLLPQGALRSAAMQPSAVLDSRGETLIAEWLGILAWNLTIPVIVPVLGNFLLRIGGYPLGYLLVLLTFVQYGLVIGTNSFAIPYAQRMAPSFAIFARAAPYEMAAYLLIVAATYSLARFEMTDFAQGTLRRVHAAPRSLSREQWVGLALGLLLIGLAGLREAGMILAL